MTAGLATDGQAGHGPTDAERPAECRFGRAATLRRLAPLGLTMLLAACQSGIDLGAYNLTRPDFEARAKPRPKADSRGVISYPSYQVALARPGETVADMAARLGLDATELARFNGLKPDIRLRGGELVVLPRRIPDGPAGGGSGVDIESIASNAIARSKTAATGTKPSAPPAGPARPAARTGPRVEPVRHRVERGETAYSIARLYGVSVTALAEWNGLGPDFAVREGQQLLIPLVEDAPAAPAADPTPPGRGSPTPVPPSAKKPLPRETKPATPPPSPELGKYRTEEPADRSFLMPVEGEIVKPFTGKGRNEGIDIAATPGDAVKAAEDGTVALVSRAVGAGTIVLLRHADNIYTVYANIDGVTLNKGDRVRRGQKIGTVAKGDPTVLHFEVRRGTEPVDPMPFL